MWQPIETAPKDGTRVLLTDRVWVDIGRWKEDCEHGQHNTYPGWELFNCEDPWYSIGFDSPTYWMPLPEPPPAQDRQKRQLPTH